MSFSSRKKVSLKKPAATKPTAIKSIAPAPIRSTKPKNLNNNSKGGAPDIISLPPSRLSSAGIPPHPGPSKNDLKLKIKKTEPAQKPELTPAKPTSRIALPPSKSHQNKGKLAASSTTSVPKSIRKPNSISKPKSSFKTSSHSKGQITYLDPLAFRIFRSVGIKVNTEIGRTYLIQTTSDGVSWDNFSDPIVGDGSEKTIYKEIGESTIREYRVKVTQTN